MFLIVGGRGKVARALAVHLVDEGQPVRVASRDPENVVAPADTEVVRTATAHEDEWSKTLDGVVAAFVYADPARLGSFLSAASSSRSLTRIALLSAMGIDEAPLDTASPIVTMHRQSEQMLHQNEYDWTIVRAGGFATNTLQWAPGIREQRRVNTAFPDAHANLIHERDIAEVAGKALTTRRLTGEVLEISGPESITEREQVAAIATAIGHPVELNEIPEEEHRRTLSQWGDERMVDTLIQELRGARHHPAHVTSTVEDVTGHPALPFQQWAHDHVADFR